VQVKDKEDSPSSLGTEEHLRSLLEPTLKETTFPLGTDVKVSRVSIEDFDECASEEYNDCSTFATCGNTQVILHCRKIWEHFGAFSHAVQYVRNIIFSG